VKTAALAALDPVMSVAATAGPAQSAQIVLFTPNRIFFPSRLMNFSPCRRKRLELPSSTC
jgi:hypothetical protein